MHKLQYEYQEIVTTIQLSDLIEKLIGDNNEEPGTNEEKIKSDPWLNEEYKGKPLKVKSLRVRMNKGYNVYSTYHNTEMNKWIDDENITHPYIAIEFSQINPRLLQEISHTMDIKAMADTGAQCSIFTFGAIRSIGVEPLGLKQSGISIVGVGGKPLDGIVREICIKLVNRDEIL